MENVQPSLCDLKLKIIWTKQQHNDPAHSTNLSINVWVALSLNLNLTETLWYNLRQIMIAISAWNPTIVADLKLFCQ